MTTTRKSLRRDVLEPAATDRVVARVSPANRDFVAGIVRQKRNEGLREPTAQNWARAMLRLDEQLQGRPFKDATAEDLAGVIERLRRLMKNDSVRQFSIHVKAAYRELLDTDTLPRAYGKALKVRQLRVIHTMAMDVATRLIKDAEFDALLAEAVKMDSIRDGLPMRVLGVAILWTLRDSAMRADEMLSLNVGDVQFRGDKEADLRLRPEAPSLGDGEHKTGPRVVPVRKCVGPLKALLALHPRGGDMNAPLFPPLHRSRGGNTRLRYESLLRWIRRLRIRAGLDATRSKGITPHDFRHTRMTELSKIMPEADQRAYAGWRKDSKMPGVYSHVEHSRLVETVNRDADITETGHSRTPVPNRQDDLVDVLARLLEERSRRARAPS